ncbi:hypothetical protein PG996_009208 [Apiospora saccharicola]|uniref:Uncharacterized protein n=1 Tax=Apiospora saccharicola TaxID=335842 RepID=A0ABR1UK39_9PEZI
MATLTDQLYQGLGGPRFTQSPVASKDILAFMGITIALLAISSYHVQDLSAITDMSLFVLLKLLSWTMGRCVLRLHHSSLYHSPPIPYQSSLRRQTDDHELAALLAVCGLVIYQQGGIGLTFFSYQAEMCFWLGYWFEWWTGILSSLLHVSGCTSDNQEPFTSDGHHEEPQTGDTTGAKDENKPEHELEVEVEEEAEAGTRVEVGNGASQDHALHATATNQRPAQIVAAGNSDTGIVVELDDPPPAYVTGPVAKRPGYLKQLAGYLSHRMKEEVPSAEEEREQPQDLRRTTSRSLPTRAAPATANSYGPYVVCVARKKRGLPENPASLVTVSLDPYRYTHAAQPIHLFTMKICKKCLPSYAGLEARAQELHDQKVELPVKKEMIPHFAKRMAEWDEPVSLALACVKE